MVAGVTAHGDILPGLDLLDALSDFLELSGRLFERAGDTLPQPWVVPPCADEANVRSQLVDAALEVEQLVH